MLTRRIRLFSLVTLLAVLSVVGFAQVTQPVDETALAIFPPTDQALKDLVNYRRWTPVNESSLSLAQGSSRGRS